jgi:hypothetical protein
MVGTRPIDLPARRKSRKCSRIAAMVETICTDPSLTVVTGDIYMLQRKNTTSSGAAAFESYGVFAHGFTSW